MPGQTVPDPRLRHRPRPPRPRRRRQHPRLPRLTSAAAPASFDYDRVPPLASSLSGRGTPGGRRSRRLRARAAVHGADRHRRTSARRNVCSASCTSPTSGSTPWPRCRSRRRSCPRPSRSRSCPGCRPSPGKGLGSRLLGSLRDCDALMLVVRAADGNDAARDLRALEDELVLADLGSVEQRLVQAAPGGQGRQDARGRRSPRWSGPRPSSARATPIYRSDLTADERGRSSGRCSCSPTSPRSSSSTSASTSSTTADALARAVRRGRARGVHRDRGRSRRRVGRGRRAGAAARRARVTESVVPRLAALALHLLGRNDVPHDRRQGVARVDVPRRRRPRPSARASSTPTSSGASSGPR